MSLLINPNLKPSLREEPSVDIKDLLHGAKQQEAVKILRENYDQLLPRWKGIVMTNVSLLRNTFSSYAEPDFSTNSWVGPFFLISVGSRAGSSRRRTSLGGYQVSQGIK